MLIDEPTANDDANAAQVVRLDRAALRAIAHPLRVRLLALLRSNGPATATSLGRRVGQSSGVTSYHLRQLEASGLVAEDEGRGNRRERWWKAAHRSTQFDPAHDAADPEVRALGEAYMRSVAGWYSDRMWAFLDGSATFRDEMGSHWDDAWTMSDSMLAITPEQATRLLEKIGELVQSYHRAEPGELADDQARVIVQWQVLPQVPEPRDAEDDGQGLS